MDWISGALDVIKYKKNSMNIHISRIQDRFRQVSALQNLKDVYSH